MDYETIIIRLAAILAKDIGTAQELYEAKTLEQARDLASNLVGSLSASFDLIRPDYPQGEPNHVDGLGMRMVRKILP